MAVGAIDITVSGINKKDVPGLRVHPDKPRESVVDGATSFDINISDFIKTFNKNEGFLLKRIPDPFLTFEQIKEKQRVLNAEKKNDQKLTEINAQIDKLNIEKKNIQDNYYSYNDSEAEIDDPEEGEER